MINEGKKGINDSFLGNLYFKKMIKKCHKSEKKIELGGSYRLSDKKKRANGRFLC